MTSETPSGGAGSETPMLDDDVSRETMMRYLDGELSPEDRRRFEAAIERSTELRRELAIYRTLHEDLAAISFDRRALRDSVWTRVNRRLTKPVGWLFFSTGVVAWLIHFLFEYLTSTIPSWEKMATSAVVIGVLLLFASVIHERYRELLTDPYRNVER